LHTPAERQQWVDQFRASRPVLSQLPEVYETTFVNGTHGDVFPEHLSDLAPRSTAIAVLRVLSEDLDTTWSDYPANFGAPGAYFGVRGRSQLAIEEVVKGEAASLTPFLTQPFFVVADSQCRPVVALPAVSISETLPVFQGEHAVIFVFKQALRAVVPIDAQGRVGRADGHHIHLWEPSRTGQEFIDMIRALLAPSPTPGP
jgi:hypothetical protein